MSAAPGPVFEIEPILLDEPPAPPRSPSWPARAVSRVVRAVRLVVRLIIGVALCAHPVGAVLVVGWTFRLMRRRVLAGWWRASRRREEVALESFLARRGMDVPARSTPRWLVGEHLRARLGRLCPDGRPPSTVRRLARLPRALTAGLAANLGAGLKALACTYALTAPAALIWLGSWHLGWNISFNKDYEQSGIGLATGLLGGALFLLAMTYVPMAWAHLAATGDPRAFFEFRFVRRLARHRLLTLTLFTALFAAATVPVSVLRSSSLFLPQILEANQPGLRLDDPATVRRVATQYIQATGLYIFPAFVALHLLAARIYRSAVLGLLRRDPATVGDLHPELYRALDELGLLPEGPTTRPHPLVAVVLGTGRRGLNLALRVATLLLWFAVVAQVYIVQFFDYRWFTCWFNQPLIHLPTLFFIPVGAA